jgi:hypothetical protein
MLEVLFMPAGVFDIESTRYGSLLVDSTPSPPLAKRRRLFNTDVYNYFCTPSPPSPAPSPYSSLHPDDSTIKLGDQHTSFAHLPAELVDHIVSFVNINTNELILAPWHWSDFSLPRTTGLDVDKYIDILSLPRFTQLQSIVFHWEHKVDDDTLCRLFDRNPHFNTSVTTLEIQRCHGLSDYSMHRISKLALLQHLRLYNSSNWRGITDKGVEELSKLTTLQTLQLNYFKRITNDGLSKIAKLPALRELLIIGSCQIADQGIKNLSSLHNLSHLAISLCGTLTDDALRTISTSFPALRTLALGYNNPYSCFTDAGLLNLLALVKLKELRLERTWGLIQGEGAKLLRENIADLQIKQW